MADLHAAVHLLLIAQGDGGMGSIMALIVPMGLVFFVMYFLVMRPQQKEAARQREMIANIKKNDRVLTVGGVIGTVQNVNREQNEVVIKVDEASNTKMRFMLSAVHRVLSDDGASESGKSGS